MEKEIYDLLHDITNKLTIVDGKTRKLSKTISDPETTEIIDRIIQLNSESLQLIADYRENHFD